MKLLGLVLGHPMVKPLRSGKSMKPSTNGNAQPDLIKMGQEAELIKTRTYKTPEGEPFTVTEDEFNRVVEIFEALLKIRNRQNTQMDTLELESCAQNESSAVEKKVG